MAGTGESRAARFPRGAMVTAAQLETSLHEVVAELRPHEPVSWLPALGGWFVTTRELVLRVLRDPDGFTVDDPRFSTARILGPSMLSLDGAEHRRHREPFAPAFRSGEIRRSYAAWLRDEASRVVDELRPSGTADLRRALAGPLAVAAIVEALGLRDVDRDTVRSWYAAIVAEVSRITLGEVPTSDGKRAFAELRDAVASTIAEAPKAYLTSVAGQGSLDEAELAANVGVLMFGAIETAEGMTANALFHLLSHPGQMRVVQERPDRIADAVEESLRLEPAAAVVDRYATSAVELGGAPISRGDLVVVSLAGANRDPTVFVEPDRFDIDRENSHLHLSFVAGPHTCLGMHMARLETIAAVEAVVDRLDEIVLDESRSSPPSGLVFRKPASVTARWPVGADRDQPSTTA